jgi:hypothetical protein
MAFRDQTITQVRTDETGSAGHDEAQFSFPPTSSRETVQFALQTPTMAPIFTTLPVSYSKQARFSRHCHCSPRTQRFFTTGSVKLDDGKPLYLPQIVSWTTKCLLPYRKER